MFNPLKQRPETKGYLALTLHAHLPYIRHHDRDDYMEERWFYEAMTETYLPLIDVFERLIRDRVDFRITMSLTPTLLALCGDPLMQERYLRHLDKSIELAEKETVRLRKQPKLLPLAQGYVERFSMLRQLYLTCECDVIRSFKRFQELGVLEIITCAATHGFLPLMKTEEAITAQIATAVRDYEMRFERAPRGFWLPECGYATGIDRLLKAQGIDFFLVDSNAIEYAAPHANRELYAPLMTPYGVSAFPRDPLSSQQVWSSTQGYPGDFNYREYYRDIGWDLGWNNAKEWEYIRPYVLPTHERVNTGIKYYRITGKGTHREPYNPMWARERAAEHAGHFLFNRIRQAEYWHHCLDRKPIIVSPYDAELFGHWWYEGPQFIDFLCRKIFFDQHTIRMITPSEYLQEYPLSDTGLVNASSWGRNHSSEVWLQPDNDWLYRHLHQAEERMVSLSSAEPERNGGAGGSGDNSAGRIRGAGGNAEVGRSGKTDGLRTRAFNQAARELMLAQSSDWAFIMDSKTVVDYAVRRSKQHLGSFHRLCDQLESGVIDELRLTRLEEQDNCFPAIDYRDYRAIASQPPIAILDHAQQWDSLLERTHKQPNIFMLAWEYPPKHVGGLSRAVSQLSEAMAAQGAIVHVITSSFYGAPLFEELNGVFVHRLPVMGSGDTDFFDWVFEMNLTMIDHLTRWKQGGGRIDLLHAHDWMVLETAREIKQSYDAPLVATIHATEWGRNQGNLYGPLQQRIHHMEWELCYEAQKVFVCSEYMKREVESIFQLPEGKTLVFPNGIDLPQNTVSTTRTGGWAMPVHRTQEEAKRALPWLDLNSRLVFYVGRLVFEKGVQVLIEAIPRILSQVPATQFVIGGSGPMQEELQRMAGHLGDRVIFAGFVDCGLRDQIYEAADICVFPSLYEPFGIVALEAMKYGKPVVVSDTGGLSEIIDHGIDGFKALPGHVDSLAWHITELLLTPKLGARMAESARAKLNRKYRWPQIAKNMREVYMDLLVGHRQEEAVPVANAWVAGEAAAEQTLAVQQEV
jgi:1,4-alpha-glucan branching enzyme